ncbi:MAG: hypothetical protein ACYTFY_18475 [Planctomycetota bacterium]
MSPAGPATLKWYIYKKNPIDQPVKPWATEWMYKLSRYYSITLSDGNAAENYKTMFKYYHKRKTTGIPKGDKYIGMALFQDAMLLHDTGHGQQAAHKFKSFLVHFGNNADVPDEYKNIAKMRAQGWGLLRE